MSDLFPTPSQMIEATEQAVGEMCVNCENVMKGHSVEGGCPLPGPFLYTPREPQPGWIYHANDGRTARGIAEDTKV